MKIRHFFAGAVLCCAVLPITAMRTPVVLLDGLGDYSDNTFYDLTNDVVSQFPGIDVLQLKLGDGLVQTKLVGAANDQPKLIQTAIKNLDLGKLANRKFIFAAWSQSALMARAWVEQYDNAHRVQGLILLNGMQYGQFGYSQYVADWIKKTAGATVEKLSSILWKTSLGAWIIYSQCMQNRYVPCGYWRNPSPISAYGRACQFLPKINNEINHPDMKQYKDNILALKVLGAFATPKDDIICPWQSGIFCTPDTLDYKTTDLYKNDRIGLKTLDQNNKLYINSSIDSTHSSHLDPRVRKEIVTLIGRAQ
jgi:hypothetical protein